MTFTDPEERQQRELMAELAGMPVGGDPSFGQKISVMPSSIREQRRLAERYERRKNPDRLLMPGGERHDA